MNPPVTAWSLGRVEYPDGLELQRQFIESRRAELAGDTLLLLEHPAVLTLGRGAKSANILTPADQLAALGVEVHETDRGGDVTYHGPGQLVGYPLLHLGPGRQDVRKYVRSIEALIIRTLADFDIAATRLEKWPGVWVEHSRAGGPRKICALGVHLSRWYTTHGFALNVDPDLRHFELIIPCGIREAGVTSMRAELGQHFELSDVIPSLTRHFGEVFECEVVSAAPASSTVCVVISDGARVLLLRRVPARGGFWQPVTGRVEQGEALAAAARRELEEETGLRVDLMPLGTPHAFAWGDARPPRLGHETAFLARVAPGTLPRLSDEHDAFEWLGRADALARVPFAGFKRAIALALPAP
jgi:lipoyl(octanoyl) transferase